MTGRVLPLLCFLPLTLLAQQLEIVSAGYGAGRFQMDVAVKLRELVANNALDISAEPAVLGGDPAPGQPKRLRVRYRYNGTQYEAAVGDFERLRIPQTAAAPSVVTPAPATPAPANPGGFSFGDLFGGGNAAKPGDATLRIVSARYGGDGRFVDVRDHLQGLVRNNALAVKVENSAMGSDPAIGKDKVLEVSYEYRGATYRVSLKEGATLALPEKTAGIVAAGQTGLRIASARYGADTRFNDVRERLQAMILANTLSVKVDNAAMGGDPAPAREKSLEVAYEYNGVANKVTLKEGATLALPLAGQQTATVPPPVVAAPVLRIVSARYGGDNRFVDVRDFLQGRIIENKLAMKVDNASIGSDPAIGKDKALEVTYEYGGVQYQTTVKEGRSMSLPDSAAKPALSGRGAGTDASRGAGTRNIAAPVASTGNVAPIGAPGGLRIFYARYGVEGREADVREKLRPLLQNDALRTSIGGDTMGVDPAPNEAKRLVVIYEYKGRTYEKTAVEGDWLQLP